MTEHNFFRKYIDIINEAPATAINPNDPNAAAFGKSINLPAQQNASTTTPPPATAIDPNDKNAAAFGKTINAPVQQNATVSQPINNQSSGMTAQSQAQKPPTNPKLASINQQVAKSSNVVDPNAPKGGGYDPSKVQYAYSGGQSTSQPINNQSSGMTAQSQAQNSQVSPQPAVTATNQPQPAMQATTASIGSKPPAAEPSLASQYVSANQPQTVAEEDNDGEDDLLKSIIRLIKQ